MRCYVAFRDAGRLLRPEALMKQRTKILLLYLFCSLVWVVGSDLVLLAFDQEVMPLFQGMKGIVFILVSSVFIYLLISKTEKLQELEEEKEKSIH